MVLFSARATWLAAALSLFASVAAHAAISDCEELKQASIKEQLDRCVAHAACSFVLASKPDCAEGGRFLERTKGNALSQLTGLFNRNKALSANDVYEANLPEFDHPQDWKDRFAAIRDKVAQSGTEALSGKLADGTTWLYQGDVRDGKQHGWGVLFWAGGGMHRGEFAQDWRTGQGEYSAPNGYRAVGTYANNLLDGEGWERQRDGARKNGYYAKGNLEGAGSLLFPNGDSYTGNFVGSAFNGRGTYRWASSASFEGNFTNGTMDGQGTYTSASGEKSPRTYNAGTVVASAAPAAAPVSPAVACNNTLKTCTTICAAGGVLGLLLSGGKRDTAAAQKCLEECNSTHDQCLAGASHGVAPCGAACSGTRKAGDTHLGELSPPGNARSRNECVGVEWLSSLPPADKAGEPRLRDRQYFGTSYDGKTVDQKVLVVHNKCGESLLIVAFGCEEDTMLSRGNYGGPSGDSWIAGEHTGTDFSALLLNIANDTRRFAGYSNVAKNVYGSERGHRVVMLFYGAWLVSEIAGPNYATNPNAASLNRKMLAVRKASYAVVNRASDSDTGLYSGGKSAGFPTKSWRALNVKPCAAFRGFEAWEGTQ